MNIMVTGALNNINTAEGVALYTEIRKQITGGLIFSVHSVENFEEIPQLGLAVDFINMHSYDLNYDGFTTFSAPVTGFSTSASTYVNTYTSMVAPDKLNLGIPIFGICMVLKDPAETRQYSRTFQGQNFVLPYSQVRLLKSHFKMKL